MNAYVFRHAVLYPAGAAGALATTHIPFNIRRCHSVFVLQCTPNPDEGGHAVFGEEITVSGKCPETVFVGVVPKNVDAETPSPQLTPEVERRIPEVIDLIMKEINEEP